jgi:multidrug resistance efflux pump
MTKAQGENEKEKKDEFEKKPKRKQSKLFWFLIVAVPLGAIASLYFIPSTFYVAGYGNILSADDAVLRAGSKGPVRALLARTGERVKQDQVILELEDDVERAEVERCKRELAKANADLTYLLETNRLEEITDKLAIESAKLQYADSQKEVSRLSTLYKTNAVSEYELRVATTKRELDRVALEEKTLNRNELRGAQVEIKKRNIDTLKAQLTSAERMLARRKVLAPMAGVLVMHSYSIGQVVDANEVLGQIFDDNFYQIIAQIPEQYQYFLKTGQGVDIELSAYPWWDFGYYRGEIYRVSPVVNPQASGDGTVMIKARIESHNSNTPLKAGMSGKIWINAGKTSVLERILGTKPYGNNHRNNKPATQPAR